jgi:hypothetical protein
MAYMNLVALPPEPMRSLSERVRACAGPVRWAWVAARAKFSDSFMPVSLAVDSGSPVTARELEYDLVRTVVEEVTPAEAARRLEFSIFPFLSEGYGDVGPDGLGRMIHNCWWLTTEHPSAAAFYARNEWPSFYASLDSIDKTPGQSGFQDRGPVFSKGKPYFPSLKALYEQEFLKVRTQANVSALTLLRLEDKRGRCGDVTFVDGALSIPVELNAVCQLSLAWREEGDPSFSHKEETVSTGTWQMEFDQLPAEFWAVLSSNGDLLDRRGWGEGLGYKPGDPDSNLVRNAQRLGEGLTVEFKEKLGVSDNEEFAETVASFANGQGGYIFLGIRDDATVAGFSDKKVPDTVTSIVRANVVEFLEVGTTRVEIDGKPVWIVSVPSGSDKPYRCKGKVMVRAGGTDRLATTFEHRRLSAKTPEVSYGLPPYI